MTDTAELAPIAEALKMALCFQGELGLTGLDLDPSLMLRAGTQAPASPKAARRILTDLSAPEEAPPVAPANAPVRRKPPSRGLSHQLLAVHEELGDCCRCKLHGGRTHIVFGVGNSAARLMFVGEGPGRDEDLLGEPFVGAAGKLLDRMILAMGLSRSDVYIANIVKCRPPKNRDPEPDEVAACEPFLVRQIEAIQPEVLVALGRVAAQTLLRTDRPISRIRGTWQSYRGTPLLPTYHPAYLLRNPAEKRPVWQDLQQVMQRLGLPLVR